MTKVKSKTQEGILGHTGIEEMAGGKTGYGLQTSVPVGAMLGGARSNSTTKLKFYNSTTKSNKEL